MDRSGKVAFVVPILILIAAFAYAFMQPVPLEIRYIDHEASFNNGVLSINLFVEASELVDKAEISAIAILGNYTEGNLTHLVTSFTMFYQSLEKGINRIHVELLIEKSNADIIPVIIFIKAQEETFDFRFKVDVSKVTLSLGD